MSDYEKYLASIAADANDNLYTSLGGISDSLSGSALQYVQQPGADIGESILYGSILGLLGGSLGQIGKNQAAEETNLASKVLTGALTERPEGLPQSLYSKSLSYKNLIDANRKEALADKIFDEKLGIQSTMLKDINKQDIDLDYISKRKQAEESAERARLLPLGSGDTSSPAVSPLLQSISERVPSEMQSKALEEMGTMAQLENSFKEVDENLDSAFKTSTTVGSLDPTGAAMSFSEKAKMYDTAKANLTANVLKIWKGPLDQNDARRIVDPYIPNKYDTAETVEAKRIGLKALLAGNAKETPILEAYGIKERPSSMNQAASPVSSGVPNMKQQALDFVAKAREMGLPEQEIMSRWSAYKQSLAGPSSVAERGFASVEGF